MKMDTKQSALLLLTICAFGFLGYQIFAMVSSDLSQRPVFNPPAASPVTQKKAVLKPSNDITFAEQRVVQPSSSSSIKLASQNPAQQVIQVTPKPQPHVVARQALAVEQPEKPKALFESPFDKRQAAYLRVVNEYELAKMQRRLIEEQAAIASAKNRILQINQQTEKLSQNMGSAANWQGMQHDAQSAMPTYQLSYVDQQNGEWTATLNQQGRYLHVSPGNTLPSGAQVESINHEGVVLAYHNKRERVTFNGIVPLMGRQEMPTGTTVRQVARLKNEVKQLREVVAEAKARQLAIKRKADAIKAQDQIISKELGLQPITIQARIPEALSVSNVLPPPKPAPSMSEIVAGLSQPAIFNSPNITLDEKQILKLTPSHYTIQLVGSYHEDDVENFAIANQIQDKTWQYTISQNGKLWYALLYGDYTSKREAELAMQALPKRLRPEGPEVTAFAQVQKRIRYSLMRG